MQLLLLDLAGIAVFAISGGLVAVHKRFDLLGVVVLACAAALGGGILRDVLTGVVPPRNISDPRLLGTAAAAGLLTFYLHPGLARVQRLIVVFDAFGLALFAVSGTYISLERGIEPLPAAIVGVLTGVGGGVIRDLLAGDVPRVLVDRELYAIPAAVGAAVYATLWSVGLDDPLTAWACAGLVAAGRLAAIRFRWQAPVPRP